MADSHIGLVASLASTPVNYVSGVTVPAAGTAAALVAASYLKSNDPDEASPNPMTAEEANQILINTIFANTTTYL